MVTDLGLLYLGAGTLLFFFWAYGIYAFVRDLRQKFLPGLRQYLRGRRRLKERRAEEREQEEQRRGLR